MFRYQVAEIADAVVAAVDDDDASRQYLLEHRRDIRRTHRRR